MKKIKKNLIIVFLFMLLFLAAIAPVFLTEIRNKRMVDKPIVAALPKEYLENSQKSAYDQNVVKKIQTITKVATENTGIVIQNDDKYITQEQKSNVADAVKKQINIMQSAGALPQLNIGEDGRIDYLQKTTYIDSAEPNFAVSVWNTTIYYVDFYISVTMDATSNIIYQITIDSKQGMLSSNTSRRFIQNFFQYLMLDTNKIYYKNNETHRETYCYYNIDKNNYISYVFVMDKYSMGFYLQYK